MKEKKKETGVESHAEPKVDLAVDLASIMKLKKETEVESPLDFLVPLKSLANQLGVDQRTLEEWLAKSDPKAMARFRDDLRQARFHDLLRQARLRADLRLLESQEKNPVPSVLREILTRQADKSQWLDYQLRAGSESLLFQNLIPAFDEVPLRRVFLICFYTKESWTVGFDALIQAVILTSGCELVQQYPFLEGSGVYRGALRTSRRYTRKQFENSQAQLAEQLVQTLKKDKNVGNVTVNFNFGTATEKKEQKGEWSGRFKDLTEGIRNLILAGAGLVFIFDGTLVKSSQSVPPNEVSVTQTKRQAELQALPKILDATNPQEFHEAIGSLDVKKGKESPAQNTRGVNPDPAAPF